MSPVLLVIAGPNGSGKTTVTVRLRYERSMANLGAVLTLADRVYVYDNSIDDVEARLCARTTDGALRKIYGALPAWIEARVLELPRHPELVDRRGALDR